MASTINTPSLSEERKFVVYRQPDGRCAEEDGANERPAAGCCGLPPTAQPDLRELDGSLRRIALVLAGLVVFCLMLAVFVWWRLLF